MTPRLLTFAPMIDSECSRLALTHHRIAYAEEDHLFGLSSLLTLPHGGFGQIPILYGKGVHLTGPRAIVEHYDPIFPSERRLIPSGKPERAQFEADWTSFNMNLGAWVARVSYFYLLPNRALMVPLFQRDIPAWEQRITGPVYPALRGLFTVLLKLQPAAVADAVSRIDGALAAIDARLANGRRYLIGNGLTLSDLAAAASLSPLVLPPAYAARLPPLNAMGEEMRKLIARVREHPVAAFVNRISAEVHAQQSWNETKGTKQKA